MTMKLFQINEDDLAELERLLPTLCETVAMSPRANASDRVAIRVVQRIIRDVRWNYGPPTDVEIGD